MEDPDTVGVWDFSGTGSLNLNQISLSNWSAGGQNSFSVLGAGTIYANYKKGKGTWNNALDITYGLIKLEGRRMQKSDDRVELNLKYGYRASKEWYYTGQLNVRSQLTPTYTVTRDTLVSNLFSPMYVLTSLGMDFKPNDKLSVFLSPLTGKFTIVESQMLADRGAFGVERAEKDPEGNLIPGTGKHLRKEFGGYINVRYKNEILENVLLQSKLDLFSNYLKDPENIDLNFENQVSFKFNEFISANFFLHMIYDDDVKVDVDRDGDGKDESKGPRLQVKQMLGIGLSYKFE
ncbi:DUF3078 domain-containing protein [Pontibacter ummariensis]|uniref:DUF3078 domain-containing protein n=1 Tax=Pontibacter ummariensis TaxID=1610492 RepID=UPI001FE73885|nr:DUF3078 domain-containing protein [Pontibacter ummariensis]